MQKHPTTLVILLSAASLAASTVVPLSFKDLSTRAHRVVTGRIDRLTSYQHVSGRIHSRVEISGPTALSFEMVGGTVGDLSQWIAGFPALREGDRVALFLNEDTASPLGPTVGLWQGVFFLDSGVVLNHRRQALQEIRGDELILAAPASRRRLTLDAFLSRVAALRIK